MNFKAHIINKIHYLVVIYYQLGNKEADNLETL